MKKYYIRLASDIYCDWQGTVPPVYRSWVNDEMFVERTFVWHGFYLTENLQLEVPAGKYEIKFELLPHDNAVLSVRNTRILTGPGKIKSGWLLKVGDDEMA